MITETTSNDPNDPADGIRFRMCGDFIMTEVPRRCSHRYGASAMGHQSAAEHATHCQALQVIQHLRKCKDEDEIDEIRASLRLCAAAYRRARAVLAPGLTELDVYLAMHEMRKAHNPRKALLIISDGGDNSSRYTETEIKNAVREADVQIFGIGIFESMGGRSRTPEEAAGPSLLNELAEQTGGREYAVDNIAELPDIAAKIGVELRNEYILGYSPKNRERDGKYRKVQVKLNQPRGLPPLKAYFRLGYYAPTQ